MNIEDGQTTEISRRCEECIPKSQRKGLGLVSRDSQVDGTEQIRISGEDREGGDTPEFFSRQGNTPVSKVLQRLELIEQEYLSYVHGHQERLETRLVESHSKEEGFKKAVAELKQEIYNLATEQPE